ncbi:MAG: DedA family protein [Candidatus Parcubacteria bacterium]|nr:DedA family protein [Candidatus Parcubacteria bacterium]
MFIAITEIFNNMGAFLGGHTYLSYAVLFLGSYFETVIGPGFFIYGEFFFLPGAILAGAGVLDIGWVALATLSGGILGDFTSFTIGRRYGLSFFKKGNRYFTPENHKKGELFFEEYGAKGIFFARLLGPLSWITPFLAGTYKIPYKTFFKYNIPAVIVGIGEFLIAGYFFGSNYKAALHFIQKEVSTIVGVALFLVVLYYIVIRNNPDFFLNLRKKFHLLKKEPQHGTEDNAGHSGV